MIIETVTFPITPGMTRDDVLADARTTIPRWQGFPGLVRKTYVMVGADAAMGIYHWETLAHAEKGHDEEWMQKATVKWGVRPKLERYDTVMVLDNRHDEILEYPPDD